MRLLDRPEGHVPLSLAIAAVLAVARGAEAAPPAGTEAGVEDTLTLLQAEQTTVTASLRPESVEGAPAVVTVYDHRQIMAMGARTLLDVIRTAPGIDIGRSPLGDDTVTFRGSRNPAELLVMIDGLRINNPFNGAAPLDLPVAMIDRVEILRGPGSALYGTDAFVGVIQVFTRHPEGVIGLVEADDSGGNGTFRLDGQRYQVGAGNRTGKLYYGASISEVGRGGSLQQIGSDQLAPAGGSPQLSPLTGGSESATPGPLSDWRKQLTGDARVSLRDVLGTGDELALTGRIYSETHGEYFGPNGTFAPDGSIGLAQDQAQLSYDVPLSSILRLEARLYLDHQRIDDLVDLTPAGYVAEPPGLNTGFFPSGEQSALALTTWTYGGEARLTGNLPAHNTATAGVQLEEQAVTAYSASSNFGPGGDYLGGLVPDSSSPALAAGVSRRILGAYVQDIFEPWSQLSATGGLRLDDYSDFGSSLNPRLSLVYRPAPPVWIKALYAWAFTAPTFQQLYDQSSADINGGYVGNPTLGPERIKTGEAEIGVTVPWTGGGFDASVNAFDDDITGSIMQIPLYGNQNPFENAANVTQIGFEGQVRLRTRWVSVFGNVSDLYEDLVTFAYSNPSLEILASSSELTDVPRVLANLGVSVGPFEGLTLTALGHFASFRQNDQTTALDKLHAWTIPPEADVDLILSTATFWSFFRAFVALYNVTNTPIFNPTPDAGAVPNLPQMPRSLTCALRMDY